MIPVLFVLLIIGMSLHESGCKHNANFFHILQKNIWSQSVAASFYIGTSALLHYEITSGHLTSNLGFLGMLCYIATSSLNTTKGAVVISAVLGGLLYPISQTTITTSPWFVDVAGAGMIHFVGGLIGVLGCAANNFDRFDRTNFRSSLGLTITTLGWVSYLAVVSLPILHTSTTTWLSGLFNLSTAAITSMGIVFTSQQVGLTARGPSHCSVLVGGLAGIVMMSADPFSPTNIVIPLCVGSVAAGTTILTTQVLNHIKLPDPTSIVAIHLIPGLLGVIIVPAVNNVATIAEQLGGLVLLTASALVVGCISHLISITSTSAIIKPN